MKTEEDVILDIILKNSMEIWNCYGLENILEIDSINQYFLTENCSLLVLINDRKKIDCKNEKKNELVKVEVIFLKLL